MRFYTDDYFHIGKAHLGAGLPCQDYALSHGDETFARAIISDGCSTGGRTDVGARIVAHTADIAIRTCCAEVDVTDYNSHDATAKIQEDLLRQAQENLGLEQSDLLATCAYAQMTSEGGRIDLRGDGVMAVTYRNGRIVAGKYSWANNMPLYPAYYPDDFRSFSLAHGGGDIFAFEEDVWIHDPEKGWRSKGVVKREVADVIVRSVRHIFAADEIAKISYIALFTDGVTQVDGMDWKDAVLSLMSFKNVAGSFAKRRMISFIKDAQKTGKGPIDDIAYAVIRIDHENEEESNG